MQPHHFVFVGGLHRSGTSLLTRCLQQHPLVSGFSNTGVPEDEGQHLQTVYPTARSHGGPGRFGFDAEAHLTEDSALVTKENRSRLRSEWGRHWDLGKPILLEKSPPNLIRTRFLQAMFPSASFLIIVRHPVVVSYATRKWTDASLTALIEHWLACHATFNSDRKHLDRVYVLRYEDLVNNPAGTLASVQSFLGLEVHALPGTIRSDLDDGYLSKWRDAHHEPRFTTEIEDIRERFGDRIAEFGYSLDLHRLELRG